MTTTMHIQPSYAALHRATTRGRSHHPSCHGNGVVLIVSLVILAIMTVIAVGTVTDVSFQSNMVRNSQIKLTAFNLSMSELNAQFLKMKDEGTFLQLDKILDDNAPITLLDSGLLQTSTDNPFKQDFVLSLVDDGGSSSNRGGAQIRSAPKGGNSYVFEFNSIATLENTAIKSDQTLGIVYTKPPDDS